MSMPKKIRVAVVGAGLAGLAAAYELVKDKHIGVTLFEAEPRIGGRIKKIMIDGKPVDAGGFIIYPWYDTYHRLIGELGLANRLKKIDGVKIFYSFKDSDLYYDENDLPVPMTEKLQFGSSLLKTWVRRRPDFRNPDTKGFGSRSIAAILDAGVGLDTPLARFIDTVNQGYCYPGLSDYQMSFYAPLVYQTLVHGDLRTGYFFEGDNECFVNGLDSAIRKEGGEVRLNTAVLNVRKNKVITSSGNEPFDAIILAGTVGDLYKNVIESPIFSYTNFSVGVMRCAQPIEISGTMDWTAVFAAPASHGRSCITSVIRAKGMSPELDPNLVIVNFKNENQKILPDKKFENFLNAEFRRLFPCFQGGNLVARYNWNKTMPAATVEFVNEARKKQGKDGIYFAGDYLGAPSMETALSSGVSAAVRAKKDLLGA